MRTMSNPGPIQASSGESGMLLDDELSESNQSLPYRTEEGIEDYAGEVS